MNRTKRTAQLRMIRKVVEQIHMEQGKSQQQAAQITTSYFASISNLWRKLTGRQVRELRRAL